MVCLNKAGKDVAFSESAGNIIYHMACNKRILLGVERKTKLLFFNVPVLNILS
jgi:hypothetical protein